MSGVIPGTSPKSGRLGRITRAERRRCATLAALSGPRTFSAGPAGMDTSNCPALSISCTITLLLGSSSASWGGSMTYLRRQHTLNSHERKAMAGHAVSTGAGCAEDLCRQQRTAVSSPDLLHNGFQVPLRVAWWVPQVYIGMHQPLCKVLQYCKQSSSKPVNWSRDIACLQQDRHDWMIARCS